jgi:hypothetical protein
LSRLSKLLWVMVVVIGGRAALAETISGHVTDDGDAMPDAYVVLFVGGGNVIVDVQNADKKGNFQFTTTSGIYNVCASVDEYAYECVKGIELQGKDVSVDLKMIPNAFVEKKGDASSDGCD